MRTAKPITPTAPGTCSASLPRSLRTATQSLKPSAQKAMTRSNSKFGMGKFQPVACLSISLCPSPAGTMTCSSPERPCFSSGRKNRSSAGANETISNVEKFCRWLKYGNCPNFGITTACPWIIMDEASNRLQRFSNR